MGLEDYLLTAVHARRIGAAPGAAAVHRMPPPCPGARGAGRALRPRRRCGGADGDRCITRSAAPHAGGTGYRGRPAIAEFLELNPEVERLIFARAEHAEIERAAVRPAWCRCSRRGCRRRWTATTTIEEVVRSIRAEA